MRDHNRRQAAGGVGPAAAGLIFIVVIGAIFAFSSIAAVFATPPVVLLANGFSNGQALRLSQGYKASFWASSALLAVLLVSAYVLPDHFTRPLAPWVCRVLYQPCGVPTQSPTLGAAVTTLLLVSVPAVIAYAWVLRRQFGAPFTGSAGFLRAFVVAAVTAPFSLWATWSLVDLARTRMVARHLDGAAVLNLLFYSGMAAFVWATLTCCVAALAFALAMRRLSGGEHQPGWSDALGPVYTGLIIYAIVTAMVVFLLPGSDALVQTVLTLTSFHPASWPPPPEAPSITQAETLRLLLVAQIPAWFVFATWCAAHMGGVLDGLAGLSRTMVASAAAALAAGLTWLLINLLVTSPPVMNWWHQWAGQPV